MRTAIVVLFVLASAAHADEVTGVVVDAANTGITDAEVRIVTDHAVITIRADPAGRFRIRGVPPGPRRIEVDRGTVRESSAPTVGIQIDRDYIRCCGCRFRSFESVLGAAV